MGMLQVKQHRVSLATGAIAMICVMMLYAGCGPEPGPAALQPTDEAQEASTVFGGIYFSGTDLLEERILEAEAIARVRFSSAKQVVELVYYEPGFEAYVGALEFTFEVLEYLKGSGGTEVKAVVNDGDELYWTRAEAEASDEDFLAVRETRWDDREAIVFLNKDSDYIPSSSQADRYWLAYLRANGEDGYTVASRWRPSWLPDAVAPGSAGSAARGEQRFLLEAPESGASALGASGQTRNVQAETITTSALKALIGRLQAEVDAGDGSEEYHECVLGKYRSKQEFQRRKEHLEADPNREFAIQFDRQIASGLPAGTEVFVGGDFLILAEALRLNKPAYGDDLVVKTGRDAGLFAKGWPLTAITARPLPAGEYRFYWAEQGRISALCDAMPEDHHTRREVVVTVTPPPNTLHEAFFDPVSLASGVGADSSNGVLNPASFSVDGTSTSIIGLKWESGSVTVTLSPYVSLSGHTLDFIELDGSVSLSLAVSSATEDSSAGTLTWSVPNQPWHNADLLMLRIAASTTPEPTATPEPTPTPTSTPQPTPTPQQTSSVSVSLSPRDDPYITQTDITVSWSDATPCQGSYFVGVSDSEGYLIRLLGSHPAPATTAIDADLSLSWDNVSDYSWTVSVRCDPSENSSDWWMLGEVPLQSGLPSSP